MNNTNDTISLVERKTFNPQDAHQIADGIWWTGFVDSSNNSCCNSYLLLDNREAVLINPGSRCCESHRTIKDKICSLINTGQICHIIVNCDSPDSCASIPLFENLSDRGVRLYAPSGLTESIKHYGCKSPIIGLEDGDSIICESGRTIDYFTIKNVPQVGSGFFFDKQTGTVFSGNLFGNFDHEWNLYAPPDGWESMNPFADISHSKKSYLHALNKIERLLPERICVKNGLIIEEDIDKYFEAARMQVE